MNQNEVCLANIDSTGRRRRATVGGIVIAVSVGVGILVLHLAFTWRFFLLVPPLYFGWLGIVQANDRVCVKHALWGTQEVQGAAEKIVDDALVAALKRKALGVYLKAAAATVVTLAVLFLFG